MTAEQCYGFVCFVPLASNGQKFFGFSEILAGLALMVLAWTIADVRYRFRVRTAPIPLQGITFAVVAVVGVLALLTDLWRAEQGLVPHGNLLTPASWQALLGALFLLTFLIWAWFAFIRPPIYGRQNVERFAQTLYHCILKGAPAELTVIADELAHSVRSLVRSAPEKGAFRRYKAQEGGKKLKPPKVEAYANDLLLLIADKRLCRVIVESSPATALAVFQEIGDTKKYDIQVGTFAKNIVNEAIANREREARQSPPHVIKLVCHSRRPPTPSRLVALFHPRLAFCSSLGIDGAVFLLRYVQCELEVFARSLTNCTASMPMSSLDVELMFVNGDRCEPGDGSFTLATGADSRPPSQ